MENQPATSHVSSGLRKILEHPYIFNLWQFIVGAGSARRAIINKYCEPPKQARILEIACGTGDILEYIDKDLNVDYCGYDMNPIYIDFAKKRYGDRASFYCAKVDDHFASQGSFDIVLAIGILHHLDDDESRKLIESAWKSLKSNGFLLSAEPVLTENQTRFERYIMSKDRGRSIRTEEGYLRLLKSQFMNIESHLVSDSIIIPWTVIINKAWKSPASSSSVANQ